MTGVFGLLVESTSQQPLHSQQQQQQKRCSGWEAGSGLQPGDLEPGQQWSAEVSRRRLVIHSTSELVRKKGKAEETRN